MQTKRIDRDGYTEIVVSPDGQENQPWFSYRISCMDFEYDRKTDRRTPPTSRISLLCSASATVEDARRLAAEYTYVADVAAALEAEKRATYVAQFGKGV